MMTDKHFFDPPVEVSYFGRELSPWQNAPALIGEGRFGEVMA